MVPPFAADSDGQQNHPGISCLAGLAGLDKPGARPLSTCSLTAASGGSNLAFAHALQGAEDMPIRIDDKAIYRYRASLARGGTVRTSFCNSSAAQAHLTVLIGP